MSRRKLVVIVLTLVCIILAVSYILNYYNKAKSSEGQPENTPTETQEGPEFVVPESPIGILGIISALAVAFGLFAVAKKRKYTPKFSVTNV